MIWSQVCVFQILTNWFPLSVSNTFESREKAKAFPVGEGYFKTSPHSPVCKFQIRTVPPVELEARILESFFVERIRIVFNVTYNQGAWAPLILDYWPG
ncbi:hypothetical protein FOXG_21182 [Fusarium oxysporum f. sp. lycopersici 4287]|uniref:Uncharacterized protein n=1 Tax=Fusarium oxysporum f. sp. lycopersici (strain 4287 / CBS 123668 / FGSC 9935 / NRRL 34936) TaxID=426428 RepID=A0A0J9VUS3_FUSO4|nr:hypothetical protein FOXG_21182 [Fusarium oxysporum f. sp. lycopersici 4287]KNB14694.1 hypothetical protein FOXG_21182 [Fusarium oxysporum f. sp. lycopersici 4287]